LLDKARKSRNLVLVAVAVGIVAVLAVVGALVLGGGDDAPKLDVAKLRTATVRILTDSGRGSGSIIDGKRGLILTNAHVVRPDAPGQGTLYGEMAADLPESPAEVVILVSKGADEPAEPQYRGQVVAYDGYVDLAVVRITKSYGGKIFGATDDLKLPSVPIGDSTTINQDDDITVFGFPGIADSNSVQTTKGSVSGFIPDERLSSNRAFINSDVAIAPGNSGGLAADSKGRLVAIPTAERSRGTDSISRLRPVHLAAKLIAAAKDGTTYTSEFVTPAANEEVSNPGFATDPPQFAVSCRDRRVESPASLDALSIAFDYKGFPEGHQDVMVRVISAKKLIGQITSGDQWPVKWSTEGCAAVTARIFDPDTGGPSQLKSGQEITIAIDVGPNYEKNVFAEEISVP
jgi:S1-C subfamily serine protease